MREPPTVAQTPIPSSSTRKSLHDMFNNEPLSHYDVHQPFAEPAEITCGERMSRARSRSTRYFAFCPLMILVLCAPFVTCTRNPSAPCNHTSAST